MAANRLGSIYGFSTSVAYNIYPSMTRCMEYIEELGLLAKRPELSDIENVKVYYSPYYRNNDLSEQEYYDMISGESNETSEESNNEVKFGSSDVADLYDDICFTFGFGFSPWGTSGMYDGNYDVEIQLKDEYYENESDPRAKTMYNGRYGYRGYSTPSTVYGQFKKGEIPPKTATCISLILGISRKPLTTNHPKMP